MVNKKAQEAARRAASIGTTRGARGVDTPVQITRAVIHIGVPFIGDDNGVWVPYTCAVEINNRAERGRTFSGQLPFPAGRDQAQRRAALRTIMQADGPGYFPEGSTVAEGIAIDWLGV